MSFPKQNGKKNRIHFTIVELLVVVAVIMIMIALLFPALQKAREKGFRISCAGNLKSLGTFFQFYMDDWQHLPAGYYMTPNSKQISWDDQLGLLYDGRKLTKAQAEQSRFFQSSDAAPLYRCPAYPSWKVLQLTSEDSVARSYSMNSSGGESKVKDGSGGITYSSLFLGVSQLKHPSSVILLAEFPMLLDNKLGNASNSMRDGYGYQIDFSRVFPVHSPDMNYLYCDGHVRGMMPIKSKNDWNREK